MNRVPFLRLSGIVRAYVAAALACLVVTAAAAQSVPLQGGAWTPGHVPMYSVGGMGQPVVQDSGPAGGGQAGLGLNELMLQARGYGAPPFANAGTGPSGTNFCDYDGPTTGPFHYLCIGANASGGGLVSYGAGGGAPQLPLIFSANGVTQQFPFFGPAGPTGPIGATGPQGTNGAISGVQNIIGNAYTVLGSDCGATIQASGGQIYSITLPAASIMPTGCTIGVKNADYNRGKRLVGFPSDFGTGYGILWPFQTGILQVQGGNWTTLVSPGRWQAGSSITFYVDHANGSDTGNDCLSTVTAACATIQHAASLFQQQVDCNGHQPYIQNAAENFTESVSLNGRQCSGVNNLQINGSPSNPTSTYWQTTGNGSVAFNASDQAVVIVNGFAFKGLGQGDIAIQANQGGLASFSNDLFDNFPGGSHLACGATGKLVFEGGSYTITGSAQAHMSLTGPCSFVPVGGQTVQVPNAVTFSQAYAVLQGSGAFLDSSLLFGGANAGNITGPQYYVADNASILLNGTTLPGSAPGIVTNNGCVDSLCGTPYAVNGVSAGQQAAGTQKLWGNSNSTGFGNGSGSILLPKSGTAKNLYVQADQAPGAGQSYNINLYYNGTATGLGCQITGSATSCSNTSYGVSVAASNGVVWQVSSTSGAPASAFSFNMLVAP